MYRGRTVVWVGVGEEAERLYTKLTLTSLREYQEKELGVLLKLSES